MKAGDSALFAETPTAPGLRPFIVRTPEQVFFRYELAGPVERICAYLIDLLCLGGMLLAASFALAGLPFALAFLYLAFFLLQWGYFLFFEWRWNGATPGKRILGLRVIQIGGVRCTLERLVLRNFLRVVDALPLLYALGGVVMLLTRDGRRIGDLAAGTVCVRVPRPVPPAAVGAIRARFNSIRDDVQARTRIRQVLAPREAALVIGLALRCDVLETSARTSLLARTAVYLRGRLHLTSYASLPDDRLVRSVAAVLLEERTL